jgi:cytochrome c-type biogenesis protein CcmH/NrfG
LGLAYERLERTNLAERAFARALQLDPENAVAAAGLIRTKAGLESGAASD